MPPATRASAGHGASGAGSSGHPPYRMDDPDDEIAAAAAKIAFDAGTGASVAARDLALQRAARLSQDRAASRGALRHELGLRPAAASPSRRLSRRRPSAPRPAKRSVPAAPATPQSLLGNDAIAFAPAAADDVAHGVADPAPRHAAGLDRPAPSHRRDRDQDRSPALRDRHAQDLESLVRPRSHDQRGRRPAGRSAARRPRRRSGISCRRRRRASGPTRSGRPGPRPAIRAGSAARTSRPRSTSASTRWA